MDDLLNNEDPYLWEIAQFRRDGEVQALRDKISTIQHDLSHSAWRETERTGKYHKLGDAITRAEHQLKCMRMLLDTIRSIDQNNS